MHIVSAREEKLTRKEEIIKERDSKKQIILAEEDAMTQSQQSRGDEEDEDMHETASEGTKVEESTRHNSPTSTPPPQTATYSFNSIPNSPSAADILRPLSTVAAQRSFPLPTSGTLALLARGHHADGRRISQDFDESTSHTTSSGGLGSSSLTHDRLLQSDSAMDATTTATDRDDVRVSSAEAAAAAVRGFTALVWESPSRRMETPTTTESKPIRSVSAYSSSSPLSSPTPSLAEGSSDPVEEEEEDGDIRHHIFQSPFASIFPEGTNTITPLIIRRYDDINNNDNSNNTIDDAADADHRTIFKYKGPKMEERRGRGVCLSIDEVYPKMQCNASFRRGTWLALDPRVGVTSPLIK
ncbi:hypothetical protein TSTA_087780 [Talaromyces stipitatus ATCC 10500]|uniref:Uncharacterized protein n=1 Tax=Talaromyces stipitatus (strain ATCC 10500 / CBS 375.48 / QM 6759 / NRRL 1006) TaxID=441959 RepID=B8M278_TALSN|nr:uncharacterized protein TSTA_087780 [Talaromyces stipitatus ATCC 10500]EED21542.1 hypothetical protein TSTA_087780 [Talaromyces stipitatus ATCC 10500]